MKRVLNFMHNPKLAHFLVEVLKHDENAGVKQYFMQWVQVQLQTIYNSRKSPGPSAREDGENTKTPATDWLGATLT